MILAVTFDGADGIIVAAIVILVVIGSVLSLAETGLTRTSRARARSLEDDHRRGGRSLRLLVENPERFLSTILLLVNICQLVAATLVGVLSAHLFGPLGVALATVFEVIVISILAEAVPKQWAVRHPDIAALRSAPLVLSVTRFPPVRLLSSALIGLGRLLTPDRSAESPDVTESELLALADVAVAEDVIEHEERALIHSIIEFGDTIVREVMVPRPDVVAVEAGLAASEVLERAITAGFSRIPVYRGNIDDIVGIAYTRDLVRALHAKGEDRPVGELARPAHYVPETKRVAPLLREMQAEKYHIAAVVDEYGGTAGVVTLEDLIEELVGEIVDEFDVEDTPIEPLSETEYRVSARMPVDELNELLHDDLPVGDWDSVGGLVLDLLGHIPTEGEATEAAGHRLVAERVKGRRIGSVRISRLDGHPFVHIGADGHADRREHDHDHEGS